MFSKREKKFRIHGKTIVEVTAQYEHYETSHNTKQYISTILYAI